MLKKNLFGLLSILSLFGFLGCNTTEPTPPNNGTLTLSQVDVSCTEAWVELKTTGVTFPVNVNFLADGSTIAQLNNLNSSDTTVYIDSLLPNKSYNIQATMPATNQFQATSSNKLAVQTLDTTSNNFTWQTYTFGDPNAGTSTLNDVAIIDANNIWAVGSIYMVDSTGLPDPFPYNLAHWDGNKWNLQKIAVEYKGNQTIAPLYGIFVLPSGEIILSSGLPYLPDGNGGWQLYQLWDMEVLNQSDGSVYHIWGTSINDLYFAGNSGTIVHYNGSSWQKIESGTTTTINDIWGANNSLVLATVCSRYYLGDYKLLSISPSSAKDYLSWPYTRLYSVWFQNKRNIFIVGEGAYVYKNNAFENLSLPVSVFFTRVRGNGLNDIYVAGCCNALVHFNGISWQQINGVYGNYEGMDVKGNLATAVGWSGGQAIIVMVKRQ